MTEIPPTTAIDMDADENCPECDAALELSGPPHGYECRDCGATFHIDAEDGDGDADICTVELTSGDGICGREKPCPYHD